MKVRTLTYNLNLLKHELKTASLRLNYLRKTNERNALTDSLPVNQSYVAFVP